MRIFLPTLLIGAMATSACALDEPPHHGLRDAPVNTVDAAAGVGSYLRGAVADIGGNTNEALAGYLSALAEDPDNLDLRQRTFELALMSGDVPTAVRLARTIPEERQTTMTRMVNMAALAHQGKINEARKAVRKVALVSPDLLQFRLMEAYLDYADGTRAPKLIQWLNALKMPSVLQGRRDFHEARLWLKDGNAEKALLLLRSAHENEPGSVGSTLLLGQVLAHQGRPDEAAAVYDDFREGNPAMALLVPPGQTLMDTVPPAFASTLDEDLESTLVDFALLVWAQGALSPARQVLNIALWLNPQDIYGRYYLGLLLEMGGDVTGSRAQYTLLTDEKVALPVRLAATIRLAESDYEAGDTEKPWRTLRALAEKYPDAQALQRAVAQMAFSRGDYKESIGAYDRLLNGLSVKAPTAVRAEMLFARGAAQERAHNYDAASSDLQLALGLDPTNAQILNYLGYMWVEQGVNLPEAFKLLKRAHLLAPTDGAITDSLGWSYYRRGEYVTAQGYLVRAVEQEPDSAEILDHLGDTYAKLGKKDEAKQQWRKALEALAGGSEEPSKGFKQAVERKLRK